MISDAGRHPEVRLPPQAGHVWFEPPADDNAMLPPVDDTPVPHDAVRGVRNVVIATVCMWGALALLVFIV